MAIPSRLTFYKGNDQFIKISGLTNGLDLTDYQNTATVRATLYDRAGQIITGFSNILLAYVPSSNGEYIGAIQDTFDPTAGGGYKVVIRADQAGVIGTWTIPVEIKVRVNQ